MRTVTPQMRAVREGYLQSLGDWCLSAGGFRAEENEQGLGRAASEFVDKVSYWNDQWFFTQKIQVLIQLPLDQLCDLS